MAMEFMNPTKADQEVRHYLSTLGLDLHSRAVMGDSNAMALYKALCVAGNPMSHEIQDRIEILVRKCYDDFYLRSQVALRSHFWHDLQGDVDWCLELESASLVRQFVLRMVDRARKLENNPEKSDLVVVLLQLSAKFHEEAASHPTMPQNFQNWPIISNQDVPDFTGNSQAIAKARAEIDELRTIIETEIPWAYQFWDEVEIMNRQMGVYLFNVLHKIEAAEMGREEQ